MVILACLGIRDQDLTLQDRRSNADILNLKRGDVVKMKITDSNSDHTIPDQTRVRPDQTRASLASKPLGNSSPE